MLNSTLAFVFSFIVGVVVGFLVAKVHYGKDPGKLK